MEEYKSCLEEFEQYHEDLRKIKKIFKFSNVYFSKFNENMQGVIADCNPNAKWYRNDELFIRVKRIISNYMSIINDQANNFINLHKYLKDYGSSFKEFKKKLSSKVKSILLCKNTSSEKSLIDQHNLSKEISKKFEEVESVFGFTYLEFAKTINKIEGSSENIFCTDKIPNKQSNGKRSRCLTPTIQYEENNLRNSKSLKLEKNENSLQVEKIKKLNFDNNQKILLNRDNISVKNQIIEVKENEKIIKKSTENTDKKLNRIVENNVNTKILENENVHRENKRESRLNNKSLNEDFNLSEISCQSNKIEERKVIENN